MANVCPSCGAENRDKARFCLGCARPLDGAGDGHEVVDPGADAARTRRRARRHRQAKAHRPAWSRWAGVMVAAVIALGAGWWLGSRQTTPAPAQAAPLPVAAVPVSVPAAPPPTVASPAETSSAEPPVEAAPTPAEAAVDRLRHSVEALEQQDRARAAAREQQQARLAQERLRADEARRKTDALATAAAAGASVPVASAPASAGPAPAPAPAAVTQVAAPSVDQLCAGSGNFLARDFCRIRECSKPSFASDPCLRARPAQMVQVAPCGQCATSGADASSAGGRS